MTDTTGRRDDATPAAARVDTAPLQPRSRAGRAMPVVIGAVIAAAGIVFGALSVANAQDSPAPHNGVVRQAKHVAAQDAYTPVNGNKLLNVNVLEDQVENYYGSASATYPVVGTVTIPAADSNYAKQMRGIAADAKAYLLAAKQHYTGTAKPAVVFDIDDTLVNTYDYTLAAQFGYDPAANQVYIDNAAFPAVFAMPGVVRFAARHGYAIYYITGRPESQRASTIKDLTSDGYAAPADGHLFLKQPTPPPYLSCAAAPKCTTIEYKSGTRRYISSQGYSILADFGDQYSDLLGGDAGHQVKLPNPMYYLP